MSVTRCTDRTEELTATVRHNTDNAKFFAMIGQELCEKVEFVCSDMWKPYLEMIERHCPNALNILDRFHIVAKMNKAIDEVRADEARRMTRDGYEPVLKKSRWCLLKRRENLTGKLGVTRFRGRLSS